MRAAAPRGEIGPQIHHLLVIFERLVVVAEFHFRITPDADGGRISRMDCERLFRPRHALVKDVPPGAKRIALVLPADFHLGAMPLREAIAARRSARNFSSASLTLEELSFLLWATQGITGVQQDDAGKVVQQFRAAPSAGARYPLETYLAVSRVDGIAPGLYRYRPAGHELILVREDAALSASLQTACYDLPFVGSAAVVFIWSAVPYRTEWKYAIMRWAM